MYVESDIYENFIEQLNALLVELKLTGKTYTIDHDSKGLFIYIHPSIVIYFLENKYGILYSIKCYLNGKIVKEENIDDPIEWIK